MSPSESERWLHTAHEITERLSGALEDVVPPDARRHLLNAQRELLTALLLIYEHQAGARRPAPAPARAPRRRRSAADAEPPLRTAPRARVSKIDID